MSEHSDKDNSIWGAASYNLGRLFSRKAKQAKAAADFAVNNPGEAARIGVDMFEAAAANADHKYFPKSDRSSAKTVFKIAAGCLGVGALMVITNAGAVATGGYILMSVGKLALFRGCRIFKPFEAHNPTPWGPGTKTLAIVDFLEAASRNMPHPWMKPAQPAHAKARLMIGVAVGALGFVMGITTVGIPSIIGTGLYAVGGFLAYRAYRTMNPFNPNGGANTSVPVVPKVA